jgi:hypothetical protein
MTNPRAYCGNGRAVNFVSLEEEVVSLRQAGRNYKEIARMTGAPLGTVCSMIGRNARFLSSTIPKKVRYVDDPRARRPDTGRVPLPPPAEVHRSSTWLIRIEET